MVPVKSEPTQPELPSVSPIRLLPWRQRFRRLRPAGAGRVHRHDGVAEGGRSEVAVVQAAAGAVAVLPLTVQLIIVGLALRGLSNRHHLCPRSCR